MVFLPTNPDQRRLAARAGAIHGVTFAWHNFKNYILAIKAASRAFSAANPPDVIERQRDTEGRTYELLRNSVLDGEKRPRARPE